MENGFLLKSLVWFGRSFCCCCSCCCCAAFSCCCCSVCPCCCCSARLLLLLCLHLLLLLCRPALHAAAARAPAGAAAAAERVQGRQDRINLGLDAPDVKNRNGNWSPYGRAKGRGLGGLGGGSVREGVHGVGVRVRCQRPHGLARHEVVEGVHGVGVRESASMPQFSRSKRRRALPKICGVHEHLVKVAILVRDVVELRSDQRRRTWRRPRREPRATRGRRGRRCQEPRRHRPSSLGRRGGRRAQRALRPG